VDTGFMTAASLADLVTAFPSLRGKGVLQRVIGISERALKARVSRNPGATLSAEESLRARDGAEAWMRRRAMGLDSMVPLEMLALPDGFSMLRDHLIRMEYGVYI
jgi:uncharacterized protein (DUF2384 family)